MKTITLLAACLITGMVSVSVQSSDNAKESIKTELQKLVDGNVAQEVINSFEIGLRFAWGENPKARNIEVFHDPSGSFPFKIMVWHS